MPFAATSVATVALVAAILVAELALIVVCLVDLVRRPSAAVTFGTKIPWILIVLFISIIGPVVYLAAGRRDLPPSDEGLPRQGREGPPPDVAQRTVDVLYGPEGDAVPRSDDNA
jgi:Phospholipase_D-nuclease N-terminal